MCALKNISLRGLCAFGLLSGGSAMALDTTGLFIEPGITYEMGKGDIN